MGYTKHMAVKNILVIEDDRFIGEMYVPRLAPQLQCRLDDRRFRWFDCRNKPLRPDTP